MNMKIWCGDIVIDGHYEYKYDDVVNQLLMGCAITIFCDNSATECDLGEKPRFLKI